MIARILLIRKLSSTALPSQSHFVFGHAFVYRVRSRGRNCRNKPVMLAHGMTTRRRHVVDKPIGYCIW
jgi:hypothetical protein